MMFETLGMYSLLFQVHTLPVSILCQRGMGLQSRGTTGRDSQRALPSMAPGDILSLWGTGLATQFLWPRPPQTCSAGSRLSGAPGRAAQSCAPHPVEVYPGALEGCADAAIPKKTPFPQGPSRICLCSHDSSFFDTSSISLTSTFHML